MTLTKIFTAAIITVSATVSFGATKCDSKVNVGRFANTNPPAKFTQVAKDVKTTTKAGVR